ncbi:tripartite motif-containing protein 16-like isoform X2 [Myxocyprinus asiaticus]|uniref:tripartite motif-containing protein 16-like isoform X2 n=1 Tax=Myxocyprinus asiaticus TaxID=70543 RepID=UPI002222B531|nr:tripartite motif-containing protein 16-like isoform X2 [Myxocyprinus asiaticus]
MAEASISVAQDQFCCSVCLDLLKDPVSIPCGHSYCMNCITDYWNQEDLRGVYRCPQCRKAFTPRPVLGKNVMIAEMVEKLKKMEIQATRPAPHHTGSRDVECDICTGRKQKAIKSCLVCLNSYCQNHLEQHENFFRSKRHNLIDATGRLKEMICPQHDKMLEIYCQTDQRCICMLCMVDEHKNHDNVSAATARTEKQRYLGQTHSKLQQRIEKKEKYVQELRDAVEKQKHSAQTAVEDCELIFTELISSIEKRRSEMTQLIRDQEKATSFQSLSVPLGSTDNINVTSHLNFDDIVKSVAQFRDKLQHFFREETEKISPRVRGTFQIIFTPEFNTREEFLQYFRHFTLDPNTMNYFLHLSEDNKNVTATDTPRHYPDHLDRFDVWFEVLCNESVDGRCYLEVDWIGKDGVDIAMTYKSIRRKGDGPESAAGRNDQSWSLFCSPSSYSFWHNNIETILPVVHSSRRIGVYVDHSAGVLSFYSVSDTMSLIHRVHTTFTQPLYPVFGLSKYSTVKVY